MIVTRHSSSCSRYVKQVAIEMNALPNQSGRPTLVRKLAAPVDVAPEVLAHLESLDDTIFAAIQGNAEALDRSVRAWTEAVQILGRETVEESRQQYLRHAKSVWHRLRCAPGHPPHRSFAALEIIDLLSDET